MALSAVAGTDMQRWVIKKVLYHSTRHSAEVTLHNAVSGTKSHIKINLPDISIQDGFSALCQRAAEEVDRLDKPDR